jgi:FAD/FMN-containing dehydrogenase
MRRLDRMLGLDLRSGTLECEAGVLLGDILRTVLPKGWFLPVVPGTQYVTVGGAIANDVHGKNHCHAGTFGRHVRRLMLLRSSGEFMSCSPDTHAEMFGATIGGLGLTGMITRAELQLQPIVGPWIEVELIPFANQKECLQLLKESSTDYQYVVSWIDSTAVGTHLGRGILQRANHLADDYFRRSLPRIRINVPFVLPFTLVNSTFIRCINSLTYFWLRGSKRQLKHYLDFFFPLDRVDHWNRLYGKRGFYQHQCVLPLGTAQNAISEILSLLNQCGRRSSLAVVKYFGLLPSRGMLSFPMEGFTLSLDFPNTSDTLIALFDDMDRIVVDAGGRLYPAKDARMSRDVFRIGYPKLHEFSSYIDPRFSSDFWRRMTA